MNHLIIFSISAGLLGVVIGWLIRGNCKELLQKNDEEWSEKLHMNSEKHEYKIKKVKSNYAKHISKLNQKLLFMNTVLEKKERYQEDIKRDCIKEIKRKEKHWKEKREGLIANNDKNLLHLNSELSLLRKKIEHLKEEEKRVLNVNIEYAYQIKTLTKRHYNYIKSSKKEHMKLKNRLVIAEDTIKKLKKKLK